MAYGYVGGDSVDVNVIEHHVLRAHEEGGPARRILEVEPSNLDVGSVVRQEENRTVELVVGIEDLCTGKAVPPRLSVAVDYAFAVDLNVSE